MEDTPQPRVVIQAPTATGGRRVRVGSEDVGVAHGAADLLEFCRRAGLDLDGIDFDSDLFEWRGGGPDVWELGTGRTRPPAA